MTDTTAKSGGGIPPGHGCEPVSEMRRRIEGGASLVVARGGEIVAVERGRGITPLLKALDAGLLEGSSAMDRVIGRAAAAICAAGRVAEVFTPLAAEGAAEVLARRGATLEAERVVATILNRDGTDSCPMEKAVRGLDDPEEMVEAVRRTLERMQG